MSTMEKLFVQIFERKERIIDQLNYQKQLYDHHLASKLLIQGITPPPWLLNSAEVPTSCSSTFPSDPEAVNKEDIISGLLLQRPPPEPSYPIAPSFYSKSVVKYGNIEPPDDATTFVERKESDGNRVAVLPQRLFGGPELTQNQIFESPLDRMVAQDCHDVKQSYVRIQRSKSRQKALELRNSGKADAQNLSQGKPASGATSHKQSVKESAMNNDGAIDDVASRSQRRNLSSSLEESLLEKVDVFDQDRILESSAEEPVAQLCRSSTHDQYGNLLVEKEGPDHGKQSVYNQEEEVDIFNKDGVIESSGEEPVAQLGRSSTHDQCGNLIAAKEWPDNGKQSVHNQEEKVNVFDRDGRLEFSAEEPVAQLGSSSTYDQDGNLIAAKEGLDHGKQSVRNQEDEVDVSNDGLPLDGQCSNVDMPMRVSLLEHKCVLNGEDSVSRWSVDLTEASVEGKSVCDLNGNIISSLEEFSSVKQKISSEENETSRRLTMEPNGIKIRSSYVHINDLKLPQEKHLTDEMCNPCKEDKVSNYDMEQPNASIVSLSLHGQHGDSNLLIDDSLLVMQCGTGKADEACGCSVEESGGLVDMLRSNSERSTLCSSNENPLVDSLLSPEEQIFRKEPGVQLFQLPSVGSAEKLDSSPDVSLMQVHDVSNTSKETFPTCARNFKYLSERVSKTDALDYKRDLTWPQNKQRKLAFKTSNNESVGHNLVLSPVGGPTVNILNVLSDRLSFSPSSTSNSIFSMMSQSRHSSLHIESGNASVVPPEQDTEEVVEQLESSVMGKKRGGSRYPNHIDSSASDKSGDNGPLNWTFSHTTSCKLISSEGEKRPGDMPRFTALEHCNIGIENRCDGDLGAHPNDEDTHNDMKTLTCSERIRHQINSVRLPIDCDRACTASTEHGKVSPSDGGPDISTFSHSTYCKQRSVEGEKRPDDMPSYTPMDLCNIGIEYGSPRHIDAHPTDNDAKNLTDPKSSGEQGMDSDRVLAASPMEHGKASPRYGGPDNLTVSHATCCKLNSSRGEKKSGHKTSSPRELYDIGIGKRSNSDIDANSTDRATGNFVNNLTSDIIRYQKYSVEQEIDSDIVFVASPKDHGEASGSYGGSDNLTFFHATNYNMSSLEGEKRSGDLSNSTPMEHCNIGIEKSSVSDFDTIVTDSATDDYVKNISSSESSSYEKFPVEPGIDSGKVCAGTVSGIGSGISVLESFTFESENSGSREDFPHGAIERASLLEQLCKSASLGIPLTLFSSTSISYQTPEICRSVPIRLRGHKDSRSTMEFNSEGAGVHVTSGETSQNNDFRGKSYSDTNFPSFHWDSKRPYSPVGKASDGITHLSGGSNKRVSSNPELTCFPIEESSEENMNDSVNEASTCILNTSWLSVPSCDISVKNCSDLAPPDTTGRESLESILSLTEINGKASLKKKRHIHRNVHGKLGKENQSASLGFKDVKKHSESVSTGFSKSKLPGKPRVKSRHLSSSEKERKSNNIVSNLKSFVPLVQKKQAAPPAKKDVRVKALEAAEAAKRLAEQKENDRKKLQEARKLERVKKQIERELQSDLARKAKEEEKIKKEAEKAARKRQREEDERKEKDRKRKRLEEAQNQLKEQDKRLAEMRKESKLKTEVEKPPAEDELNEGRKNPFADMHNVSDSSKMKVIEAEMGGCATPKSGHKNFLAVEMTREQSYEISPYVCSDDEDDEDDKPNDKFVPEWASNTCLALALSTQESVDPEEIFVPGSFCSLGEVLLPKRL